MKDANAAITLLEKVTWKIQALNGIPSHDLCVTDAMLYQLSYQSHMKAVVSGLVLLDIYSFEIQFVEVSMYQHVLRLPDNNVTNIYAVTIHTLVWSIEIEVQKCMFGFYKKKLTTSYAFVFIENLLITAELKAFKLHPPWHMTWLRNGKK